MRHDEVRISGKTGGREAAEKESSEMLKALEPELPEDRERSISALTFSRMRLNYSQEEKAQFVQLNDIAERRMVLHFADAYAIMNDLYDVVRTHEVDDSTGLVKTDRYGLPVWKRTLSGYPAEDWSQLTHRQKEDFLFKITTSLFKWKQEQAEFWVSAMMTKAEFTEKFSVEYGKSMSGTIEDRTAAANIRSAEEKYFAIFRTYISKKADAIVESMEMLGQRLKDTLGT